MKEIAFSELSDEEANWLDGYVTGELEPDQFEAFQSRLLESAEYRKVVRRYLALDQNLADRADADSAALWPAENVVEIGAAEVISTRPKRRSEALAISLAAAAAFAVGLFAMWAVDRGGADSGRVSQAPVEANGFAVIEGVVSASWGDGQPIRRSGDLVGAEVLDLRAGEVDVRFFSGATMRVQGPALVTLRSAWDAECHEGKIRLSVPPAAQGFRVHGPDTKIVDLGTEFAFEVREDQSLVKVFSGEIELQHREGEVRRVFEDELLALPSDGDPITLDPNIGTGDGSVGDPFRELGDGVASRANRWSKLRSDWIGDNRVIAWYDFKGTSNEGLIPSLTHPHRRDLSGVLILSERAAGRFGQDDASLEFRRPGSRMRVKLEGEFSAFTFASWVRIDSLDRRYNALFMGDGYETGEPHWQIRDDGALMLSVMVDDERENPKNPQDAGFHRVYFSPPIWDLAMSGQWMHLASVFDPKQRVVTHHVNGQQVSAEPIEEAFLIETLRIGNAEIGNWGQPFRETPWFAIRNLNGRIDEIAVFDAALSEAEIARLYQHSDSGRR
ncbi:MAG: LamG-like jellyroll fold domain-containing protein [Verrucomicrobiota bacterium]